MRHNMYRIVSHLQRSAGTLWKRAYSQEKTMQLNGQTINYLVTGSGSHPLLCMPGAMGAIWTDFKPQIENLDKQRFTVVVWDPPGYGRSRPFDRNFEIDFYASDAKTAHEFMARLGYDHYTVLGWSDGGICGMIMAANYPSSIRKLVIWGSNAFISAKDVEIVEIIRDISNWSAKMRQPLVDLYTEQGLQKMCTAFCDVYQNIYKQRDGDICTGLLKNIKCRTLILHGDKDPMIAPQHPDYLLKHIANARLHRFPDGKHNIHMRYASEFNDIITKFLLEENVS